MDIRAALAVPAVLLLLLAGCGAPAVNSNSDEIRLSSWSFDSPTADAELSFSEDSAVLTLNNGVTSASISGLCLIDDSRLVILAEDDEYIFDYKLAGKTLTLSNGSGECSLIADDNGR